MTRRCVSPWRWLGPMLGAIALTGCGGGSRGDEDDGATAPGTLQLSAAAQNANEAAGAVTITVTRAGGNDGAVSVALTTTAGTAIPAQDFTSVTTTVAFAAGDSSAKTVDIAITNDALAESPEVFTVTLSAASAGASVGTPASATITIHDDDTTTSGRSLNDTGVTTCANGVNNAVACNDAAAGTDQFPEQDAQHGRDVSDSDAGDGRAGFSFTKLDLSGAPLADQTQSFSVAPWACVRDNVTGLTWEVKTDDDSLRDKDWTFTWYTSTGIDDGHEGFAAGGRCLDPDTCDTEKYVTAVNSALLCGRADWRLPAREELLSLADYGATPAIAASHFPDVAVAPYWSSTSAGDTAGAVDFAAGETVLAPKHELQAVRVVSGNRSR
jgi:hypothetical protein